MSARTRTVGPIVAASLLAASCGGGGDGGGTPITITLDGRVGAEAFACGASYDGIGSTGTTFTAGDFRFYVHDVRVVTSDGAEVPVTLDDDGVWQNGGVALIDFENGDGCENGNPELNGALVGTVPAGTGTITGVRFRLGVPASRNFLDSATAPSPLDQTSMYWGWQDGYKFFRTEGRSTGLPAGFRYHLGATGCSGDARNGTRVCTEPHVAEIELDAFDPESDVVVADLASLFATLDLDHDGGETPGCLSAATDPECAAFFDAIGVGDPTHQALFRVEPRGTR